MGEHFASGNWHVTEGKEGEFVERWTEFLRWTREAHPSLVAAGLIASIGDPSRFISFAEWEDAAARDAWKQDPGFAERFSACRALCNDFRGGDYTRIVAV